MKMKKYDIIYIELEGNLNQLKGMTFDIILENKYVDFILSNENLKSFEIEENY
jgi:hypothetical protein